MVCDFVFDYDLMMNLSGGFRIRNAYRLRYSGYFIAVPLPLNQSRATRKVIQDVTYSVIYLSPQAKSNFVFYDVGQSGRSPAYSHKYLIRAQLIANITQIDYHSNVRCNANNFTIR